MEVLEFLQQQLMFDYQVLTTKMWMYYWIMIPALSYICFFAAKWAILTIPFWLPICLALSPIVTRNSNETENKEENQ